jgi:hypothetical protein
MDRSAVTYGDCRLAPARGLLQAACVFVPLCYDQLKI